MKIYKLKSIAAFIIVALLALPSCSPLQINQAVLDGQLVCATGPTVVAMYNASTGSAILARGQSKTFVDQICAIINGIPVSPPLAPVPSVSVIVPTTSVPLKS